MRIATGSSSTPHAPVGGAGAAWMSAATSPSSGDSGPGTGHGRARADLEEILMKRPRTTAKRHKSARAQHALRTALIPSVNREAKGGKRTTRLQAVAEKLVELALKGDFYAVKEIFARVDGEPQQAPSRPGAAALATRRTR